MNILKPTQGHLSGQLLISTPGMSDARFDHTVIYICAHSEEGAMGIVINKRAPGINFPQLLHRLHVIPESHRIQLMKKINTIPVQIGGPVETGRGFVLHSTDYLSKHSILVTPQGIGLTASLDILQAVVEGVGPRHMVMALGYAGWGGGQLEGELKKNSWINCAADDDLLFHHPLENRYTASLRKIGVDVAHLSMQAGSA